MESLIKLNNAINEVIKIAENIKEEINYEIFITSPLFIHQKLCSELVEIMKNNPEKTPNQLQDAMNVITAIEVLEKVYPKLSSVKNETKK